MQGARIVREITAALGVGHAADRFTGDGRAGFAPIAVGGCGRSGTTLLRLMLDSHPRICCGPESSVFRRRALDPDALADRFGLARRDLRAIHDAAASRPAFIEAFATLCLQASGKARWAEKTPRNISRIGAIFHFFPDARFVHVLRDGRDVACSLHASAPRGGGRQACAADNWKPTPCARRLRDDIECSRPWWNDPRFHTLRYEELVRDPGAVLRRLMTFLDEPWDDALLAHPAEGSSPRDVTRFAQNPEAVGAVNASSIGRWERDLDVKDRRIFKRIAGPLLIELGFARDNDW
jgi:hypothetical protein